MKTKQPEPTCWVLQAKPPELRFLLFPVTGRTAAHARPIRTLRGTDQSQTPSKFLSVSLGEGLLSPVHNRWTCVAFISWRSQRPKCVLVIHNFSLISSYRKQGSPRTIWADEGYGRLPVDRTGLPRDAGTLALARHQLRYGFK